MKNISRFPLATLLFSIFVAALLSCSSGAQRAEIEADCHLLSRYEQAVALGQYDSVSLDTLLSLRRTFLDQSMDREVVRCGLALATYYYSSRKDDIEAVRYLKEVEPLVAPSDTLAAEVSHSLSHILDGRNPDEAVYYAERLIHTDFDHHTDRYHALGYKSLIRLTDDPDSADLYRLRATAYFASVADTPYVDLINAFFVHRHLDALHPDTALRLILPFYHRMHYDKEANLIAGILLRAGRPADALPYIEALRGNDDFRYAYFYDKAIYYSLTDSLDHALRYYDRAHHLYQSEVETSTGQKISEINARYSRQAYEARLRTERLRRHLLVALTLLGLTLFTIITLWLVRLFRRQRAATVEQKRRAETLSEKNSELNDLTGTLSTNLAAMTDISKLAYRRLAIDNYRGIMEVADALRAKLHDRYPDISRTEFAYIFMEFVDIPLRDIPGIMSVNIQTVYYQRHSVHRKLSKYPGVTIDNILDASFTTLHRS